MDALVAGVTNGIVVNTFWGDPEIIALVIGPDQFDELVTSSEETHTAYIGGEYRNGMFYPPTPYGNWVFDETNWIWVPPIPLPQDGKVYTWDQEAGEWVPDEMVPID